MFTMFTKKCYLQCVKNTHEKLHLAHMEVLSLGRNKATMITDLAVSRQQLNVMADLNICQVIVKPVGSSTSGCNGYALVKNQKYKFGHGDQLEVRLGLHAYTIIFDPPPLKIDENIPEQKVSSIEADGNLKRKCSLSPEAVTVKKKYDFSIFKPSKEDDNTTKKSTGKGTWEDIDNRELLIFSTLDIEGSSKVAAFDIDGTIIKTKSGARFPKNSEDWVFNYSSIITKLNKLYSDQYKVVFFTNQAGIGQDKQKIISFKSKIESIASKICLPLQVFVATGRTVYRKPSPGMWNLFLAQKNCDVDVDVSNSFYVGDAAGRPKNWAPGKKKDHSLGDRLFAINIGLPFFTPEEYFLNAKVAPFEMPEFDPRSVSSGQFPAFETEEQEVIVMVGMPGSGKSHFCKHQLFTKGYVHINRDTLGSWQKCVVSLEEALQKGSSAVVDNTNPDPESRKRYIDVAKRHKVLSRCFLMKTSIKHAKHNNRFREITDNSHMKVGEIIINSYKKNYKEPTNEEGFSEIVSIEVLPKFENAANEKLYRMFLTES